jgi:uridine kinase
MENRDTLSTISRPDFLDYLTDKIPLPTGDSNVLIAIDGPVAAGKSTLAVDLVRTLQKQNHPVIHITYDHFLNPEAVRWGALDDQAGERHFLHSHDHNALLANVLMPLKPGGSSLFRPKIFERGLDAPEYAEWRSAAPGSLVIVDGIYLLRDELVNAWDFSIYVHAEKDARIGRKIIRDAQDMEVFEKRYFPAWEMYEERCNPKERASVVVLCDDFDQLNVIKGPDIGGA